MANKKTVEQMLTRDLAMRDGIGPDGKKWGICKDPNGWGLYTIGRVLDDERDADNQPKVDPAKAPEELKGYYTSQHRAQGVIETYLSKFWDMSDKAAGHSKLAEVI